jgi:hypothetical protein
MNKLTVNGYRLYGDSELVLSSHPAELLSIDITRYMAPTMPIIRLVVNNCKFNKGKQKEKDINRYALEGECISALYTHFTGDTYEGMFVIEGVVVGDAISFTAKSTGSLSLTRGDV